MVCLLELVLLQILPNPGGDPETFDLTFNVTDADGAVEGASVIVDNKTGTTGSAGGCTIKGVAKGEQTVVVSKTGYNNYSSSITVSANDTVSVVLTKG